MLIRFLDYLSKTGTTRGGATDMTVTAGCGGRVQERRDHGQQGRQSTTVIRRWNLVLYRCRFVRLLRQGRNVFVNKVGHVVFVWLVECQANARNFVVVVVVVIAAAAAAIVPRNDEMKPRVHPSAGNATASGSCCRCCSCTSTNCCFHGFLGFTHILFGEHTTTRRVQVVLLRRDLFRVVGGIFVGRQSPKQTGGIMGQGRILDLIQAAGVLLLLLLFSSKSTPNPIVF